MRCHFYLEASFGQCLEIRVHILYALHRKGFDNEVGEGYHVGEKENSNRIIFFLSFNLLLLFCLSNHGFWLSVGLGVIMLRYK